MEKIYTFVQIPEPQTFIITVRAIDVDKDGVTYSFAGGSTTFGVFEIDPIRGDIFLNLKKNKRLDSGTYTLNITATDDGTCCKYENMSNTNSTMSNSNSTMSNKSSTKLHTATTTVTVYLDVKTALDGIKDMFDSVFGK